MATKGPLGPLIDFVKKEVTPRLNNVVSNLNPSNYQTPIIGPVRQFQRQVTGPSWLEQNDQMTQRMMAGDRKAPQELAMLNSRVMGTSNYTSAPKINSAIDTLTSRPMGGAVNGAFGQANPATNLSKVPKMTNESLLETVGGWGQGMRTKFDMALLMKDANTVKALLPQVPPDYAARFAPEIAKILGTI
jgi:hypothetical protein